MCRRSYIACHVHSCHMKILCFSVCSQLGSRFFGVFCILRSHLCVCRVVYCEIVTCNAADQQIPGNIRSTKSFSTPGQIGLRLMIIPGSVITWLLPGNLYPLMIQCFHGHFRRNPIRCCQVCRHNTLHMALFLITYCLGLYLYASVSPVYAAFAFVHPGIRRIHIITSSVSRFRGKYLSLRITAGQHSAAGKA